MKRKNDLLISEYVDAEFKHKLEEKWPHRKKVYFDAHNMEFIFCPSAKTPLCTLRDEDGIPVLSDAIYNDADILLTGDKDFFCEKFERPKIFSPAMLKEFLDAK